MSILQSVKSWFGGTAARVASAWGYTLTLFGFGAWSYERIAREAMENPYAARGMSLLPMGMKQAPLLVYRWGRNEAGERVPEEMPDHDALGVLRRMTGSVTWPMFFHAYVWAIFCGGRFFLRKVTPATGPNAGRARSLEVLPVARFQDYVRDSEDRVTGYRFTTRLGRSYVVPEAEVLEIRCFHPADPEGAMPLFVGAWRAMQQMKQADVWNLNISKGAGRVPGYFTPKNLPDGKTLTRDQVKEAQAIADDATLERQEVNLPQVMSGAFEFKAGSVSPKDADWPTARKMSAREVSCIMGIPATLLADEKAGSLTDAGVDSEVRAMLLLSALPLLDQLLEHLTPFLLGANEWLDYDRDQIEALSEDVNALWKRVGEAVSLHKIMTRDEARQALGYDPLTPEQAAELAPQPRPQDRPEDGDRVPESIEQVKARLRAKGIIHLNPNEAAA